MSKTRVCVIGASGSGKSTLLNLMGGLDKFDGGEVIIKGRSSKDFSQSDFDSYRKVENHSQKECHDKHRDVGFRAFEQ